MQAPSAFAPQTGQPLQDTGADLAPGQCRGTVRNLLLVLLLADFRDESLLCGKETLLVK